MSILIKNILAILPTGSTRGVDIYIEDDKIAAVGQQDVSVSPDKVIDGCGKLLLPGFINAHTHAYMTAMRSAADDLSFSDWLFGRVMPMENSLTSEDAFHSSMLACMEMIRGGVTTFCDMHMFPGQSLQAAKKIGMRAVITRGLSGGADDVEGGARRLREARWEIETYAGEENISFMLAPHAMYTCDEAYLREIAEAAVELNVGIHTHLSESRGEVSGCMEKYSCSPVELYDRCGLLHDRTVAAHCVHLSEADMALLAERGVSVAVNTVSNMKLGNGFCPVPKLRQRGVNLCLGTDSAASNNSLSILREMQMVSLVHKGLCEDSTAVTAWDTFLMATKNGAKALGLSDVGEIAVGMKADLAIFDLSRADCCPVDDPVPALSYASSGWQAETVIINGVPVLESGVFAFADERETMESVQKIRERIG